MGSDRSDAAFGGASFVPDQRVRVTRLLRAGEARGVGKQASRPIQAGDDGVVVSDEGGSHVRVRFVFPPMPPIRSQGSIVELDVPRDALSSMTT